MRKHRDLDSREVELEHKLKLHERQAANSAPRRGDWGRLQSQGTPIHMAAADLPLHKLARRP